MKNLGIILAFTLFAISLSLPSASALTDITNCTDLQNIVNNLAEDYRLTTNVDCASIGTFNPLGNSTTLFTGTLNGQNYTISNLAITGDEDDGYGAMKNIGLFGSMSSSLAYDLNFDNITFTNAPSAIGTNCGTLAGHSANTNLTNVNVYDSIITCDRDGAGLVGQMEVGEIKNCDVYDTVIQNATNWYGGDRLAGLVGYADDVNINNSNFYNGAIHSQNGQTGGITAWSFSYTSGGGTYTINNAFSNTTIYVYNYSAGGVGVSEKTCSVGGLVGVLSIYDIYSNGTSILKESHSDTDIISYKSDYACHYGGGVGEIRGYINTGGSATIIVNNSYSTGSITGEGTQDYAGSFIGHVRETGNPTITIEDSYGVGAVSSASVNSGFIGQHSSDAGTFTCTNNYFDRETTGQTTDAGSCATSKTTSEMVSQTTFSGWDFTNTWQIGGSYTYPYFQWQTENIPYAYPTLLIDVFPTGQNYYNYRPVSVNATTDVDASACWFQVETSNYSMSNTSSKDWYSNNVLPSASQGHFHVYMWCNDTYGNISVNDTFWVNYDWTNPTITINLPENTTYNDDENIYWNVTFSDGSGQETTGLASYWLKSSSGHPFIKIGENSNYTGGYASPLPAGSHYWNYTANDSANNWGSDMVYFTVLATPPDITIVDPENKTYYNDENVDVNITFDDNVSWTGSLLNGAGYIYVDTDVYGVSGYISPLSAGSYNFTTYANDTDGSMNSSTVFFTVITRPSITGNVPLATPTMLGMLMGAGVLLATLGAGMFAMHNMSIKTLAMIMIMMVIGLQLAVTLASG